MASSSSSSAAAGPNVASIETVLADVRRQLGAALQSGARRRVADVLRSVQQIVSSCSFPAPVPAAEERNHVQEKQYQQHRKSDTVIVRMFEVGACHKCGSVGPAGHGCRHCGGVFVSHLPGATAPIEMVRLENVYYDSDCESQADTNKRNDTNKRKRHSPKTLRDFAKTALCAQIGELAGRQEDFPDFIVENIVERSECKSVELTDREQGVLCDAIHLELTQCEKDIESLYAEHIKNSKNMDYAKLKKVARAKLKEVRAKKRKKKKK